MFQINKILSTKQAGEKVKTTGADWHEGCWRFLLIINCSTWNSILNVVMSDVTSELAIYITAIPRRNLYSLRLGVVLKRIRSRYIHMHVQKYLKLTQCSEIYLIHLQHSHAIITVNCFYNSVEIKKKIKVCRSLLRICSNNMWLYVGGWSVYRPCLVFPGSVVTLKTTMLCTGRWNNFGLNK